MKAASVIFRDEMLHHWLAAPAITYKLHQLQYIKLILSDNWNSKTKMAANMSSKYLANFREVLVGANEMTF